MFNHRQGSLGPNLAYQAGGTKHTFTLNRTASAFSSQ